MLTLLSLIAIALYLFAAVRQWQRLGSNDSSLRAQVLGSGTLAWVLQTTVTAQMLVEQNTLNLSIFPTGSLIATTVVMILLLSSLRQKLDNLFIGVFPMAAMTLLFALATPESGNAKSYGAGVITHILLSIVSYSVLTLAAFQAILLSRQERALKQHHTRGLVNSLPPLQVMERLLFEMILAGFLLLTLALLSGFIFTDDLFAQHLAHKTLLSIIAWVVFAILLGGRYLLGWRSRTALRWTLAGFILLMLAFFGSKAVLELILGN